MGTLGTTSDSIPETRQPRALQAGFWSAKGGLAGRWLAVLVSLLGFGLRVYHLGSQSLWADEAKSVVVSSWPLLSILAEQASHEHPPLHYLLLHTLMPLAGRSEFAVRYVSLFFGVLLVGFAYVWKRGDIDWVRTVISERTASRPQATSTSAARPETQTVS